jgi:hypothetical protein
MRKKILFISNNASRTGAPISLLLFLQWLRDNTDISFDVILREGGELLNEYNHVASTICLNQSRIVNQVLNYLEFPTLDVLLKVKLKLIFNRRKYSLIYSNTITNGRILKDLAFLKIPVITHVREMRNFIKFKYGLNNFLKYKDYSYHYIAISNAVKKT